MAAVKVQLGNDAKGISGSLKEWSLRSFAYLQSKIRDAFPALKDKHFHLSWHDSYTDSNMKLSRSPISVADNDDLTYVMNYLQNATSTPKSVAFFTVIDVSGDATSLQDENVLQKLQNEVKALTCSVKQLASDMEGMKKKQNSFIDSEQENPTEQPTDIANLLFEVLSLRDENADLVESLAAAKNSEQSALAAVNSLEHELSEYMCWHEESCIELDTLKSMQMGRMENRMLKEWRDLKELDQQSADEQQQQQSSSEPLSQSAAVVVPQSDFTGTSELNATTELVSTGTTAESKAQLRGELVDDLFDFLASVKWFPHLSVESDDEGVKAAGGSVGKEEQGSEEEAAGEECFTEDSEVYD